MTINMLEAIVFNGLLLAATGGVVYYFVASNMCVMMCTKFNESSVVDPRGDPVQFILYTREGGNNTGRQLKMDPMDPVSSSYNFSRPAKIVLHGFMGSVESQMSRVIRNAYLNAGEFDIIGIDWSKFANGEYFTVARNAQKAADYLAKFLDWMVEQKGVRLEDVHLIGHSVGAHVAGLTADKIRTTQKIGRITGLDPAGPYFNDLSEGQRLDAGDATLVDILHTYMRVLSTSHPDGHVDFFPNGGEHQPGCPDFRFEALQYIYCNHGRAFILFAETILNKKAFRGLKCGTLQDAVQGNCFEDSEVYMGYPETYKNGLYYFKTREESPYSLEAI